MTAITIRAAAVDDAAELLAIYAPYVKETAITFEYEVPSLEEFQGRIAHTLQRYPYIVAVENGEILGYAFTSPFSERAACSWLVKTSIYLRQDARGKGLGKQLYAQLERISIAQNVQNLYASIAYPDRDDTYLTGNSVAFHAHLGFAPVGRFPHCAYKFGTWYNMMWMEKTLGDHAVPPAAFVPFPEIAEKR